MDRIRTLIVDDEALARDGMRTLLETDPDIEVVGEARNGVEAVREIAARTPDLVFLDIEMPERNGFEALEALNGDDAIPFVVFVTAYDEYAVRAFDVHALDYVLKPFDDKRFFDAVARAKEELRHQQDSRFASRVAALLGERAGNGARTNGSNGASKGGAEGDGHLRRLVVKRAGRVIFVDVSDIDWFEAADYYVRLHVGDQTYLIRTTMKELEASLDPTEFVRIHRSSMVRIDFIRELQPHLHGEYAVILDDETRLSLSRSRRKRLEGLLGQRL